MESYSKLHRRNWPWNKDKTAQVDYCSLMKHGYLQKVALTKLHPIHGCTEYIHYSPWWRPMVPNTMLHQANNAWHKSGITGKRTNSRLLQARNRKSMTIKTGLPPYWWKNNFCLNYHVWSKKKLELTTHCTAEAQLLLTIRRTALCKVLWWNSSCSSSARYIEHGFMICLWGYESLAYSKCGGL